MENPEQIYNQIRQSIDYWVRAGRITVQSVIENLQAFERELHEKLKAETPDSISEDESANRKRKKVDNQSENQEE